MSDTPRDASEDSAGVRIHKWLAQNGVLSRRKAEEAMTQGRVQVNGETVTDLGRKIDPARDQVALDGKAIRITTERKLYRFYKPKGVVTSLSDPEGRPTVARYFPPGESLYPVGRLDLASEGLLLLTNDGDLALRLTHPRYEVRKTYEVTVAGIPAPEHLQRWEAGVVLEDGMGRFNSVERISVEHGHSVQRPVKDSNSGEPRTLLLVAVSEGRNRFIRRMCSELGFEVRRLKRVQMGPFELGSLKSGQIVQVPPAEYERARQLLLR